MKIKLSKYQNKNSNLDNQKNGISLLKTSIAIILTITDKNHTYNSKNRISWLDIFQW